MIVDYIDSHKEEVGVEPICRVVTEHCCKVSSSTYCDARNRLPSKRTVRGRELKRELARVHLENCSIWRPEGVVSMPQGGYRGGPLHPSSG